MQYPLEESAGLDRLVWKDQDGVVNISSVPTSLAKQIMKRPASAMKLQKKEETLKNITKHHPEALDLANECS